MVLVILLLTSCDNKVACDNKTSCDNKVACDSEVSCIKKLACDKDVASVTLKNQNMQSCVEDVRDFTFTFNDEVINVQPKMYKSASCMQLFQQW